MPQSAPIAGGSEEKDFSDAILKGDGEKRRPNPGIYSGGSGWFTKMSGVQAAIDSPAVGVLPESSPSVPVKDSQRSPTIRSSSPSPYFRK